MAVRFAFGSHSSAPYPEGDLVAVVTTTWWAGLGVGVDLGAVDPGFAAVETRGFATGPVALGSGPGEWVPVGFRETPGAGRGVCEYVGDATVPSLVGGVRDPPGYATGERIVKAPTTTATTNAATCTLERSGVVKSRPTAQAATNPLAPRAKAPRAFMPIDSAATAPATPAAIPTPVSSMTNRVVANAQLPRGVGNCAWSCTRLSSSCRRSILAEAPADPLAVNEHGRLRRWHVVPLITSRQHRWPPIAVKREATLCGTQDARARQTRGNNEADPARRRIGFIVLLSQTTCARQDSNL